jgi:uncharacterized membrane protein
MQVSVLAAIAWVVQEVLDNQYFIEKVWSNISKTNTQKTRYKKDLLK